jgi:putative membrane protein
MKKSRLSPVFPLMAFLPLLWSCTPHQGGGYMGGGGGMMGYGGYGGTFMWLIVIIVIAVIVYMVYNRNAGAGGSLGGRRESPLDILKTRYAKGEISKEEFERLKRDLED